MLLSCRVNPKWFVSVSCSGRYRVVIVVSGQPKAVRVVIVFWACPGLKVAGWVRVRVWGFLNRLGSDLALLGWVVIGLTR